MVAAWDRALLMTQFPDFSLACFHGLPLKSSWAYSVCCVEGTPVPLPKADSGKLEKAGRGIPKLVLRGLLPLLPYIVGQRSLSVQLLQPKSPAPLMSELVSQKEPRARLKRAFPICTKDLKTFIAYIIYILNANFFIFTLSG